MRADVTLNGSDVGAGVLPVVNPNVNLNDYTFNVVKVTPSFCATISSWQICKLPCVLQKQIPAFTASMHAEQSSERES